MKNYKILIIDECIEEKNAILDYGSKTRNYRITLANSIDAGLSLIKLISYDLIVMVGELVVVNSIAEIHKIKQIYGGPIIIVSSVTDKTLIANYFKQGVDDYVLKPFDIEELYLRIERSIKRNGNYREIEICGYKIDEINNLIEYRGRQLDLTDLAAKTLVFLLKNKNTVLPRNIIFESVWEANYNFSSRVVDTHISMIRKETKDKRLKSSRGHGYGFFDVEKINNS